MIDADPAAIATFLLVFFIPSTRSRDASAFGMRVAQIPRAVGHAIRVPSVAGPQSEDRKVRCLREARDAYLKLTAVPRPPRADRSDAPDSRKGDRGGTP